MYGGIGVYDIVDVVDGFDHTTVTVVCIARGIFAALGHVDVIDVSGVVFGAALGTPPVDRDYYSFPIFLSISFPGYHSHSL